MSEQPPIDGPDDVNDIPDATDADGLEATERSTSRGGAGDRRAAVYWWGSGRADRPEYRDAAVVHRLRDGGHRESGVARCAGRVEAGASARHLRDVRRWVSAGPWVQQVLACGGRRHGAVPPARRHGDLRRVGASGAAVVTALSVDRRSGELRVARERRRGRDAVHRVPDGAVVDGAGARHRPGHRRLQGQLRRSEPGAGRAAGAVPEPAGQRVGRHRRRHGDPDPAAQPARGGGGGRVVPQAPRGQARGAASRP